MVLPPCVAAGINALGLLLTTNLPGDNVFISPLSIGETLGMVAAGTTEGSTAERQLAEALGCGSGAAVASGFAGMHAVGASAGIPDGVNVAMGNSLWLRGEIYTSYAREMARDFAADILPLRTKTAVNQVVARQTHGRIPELLKDDIDPQTIALLVNAVYFKGEWRLAFNKTLTNEDGVFYTQPARIGDGAGGALTGRMALPMMQREFQHTDGVRHARGVLLGGGAGVAAEVTADVCVLPYGKAAKAKGAGASASAHAGMDDRFSAVFIVPSGASRGVDVDRALNAVAAHSATHGAAVFAQETPLARGAVTVRLPRFGVDAGTQSLAQPLTAQANLTALFSTDGAGLLRMTPRRDAYISDVVHRAVVEVNEEGSTAAAATAAGVNTMSVANPVEFTVDRPFVFGIWDRALGVWMFLGKVGRPGRV